MVSHHTHTQQLEENYINPLSSLLCKSSVKLGYAVMFGLISTFVCVHFRSFNQPHGDGDRGCGSYSVHPLHFDQRCLSHVPTPQTKLTHIFKGHKQNKNQIWPLFFGEYYFVLVNDYYAEMI